MIMISKAQKMNKRKRIATSKQPVQKNIIMMSSGQHRTHQQ
jgi:hypothetical protein